MLDFLFFVKRVKNIINNFDSSSQNINIIEELHKELLSTFDSDFILYDLEESSLFNNSSLFPNKLCEQTSKRLQSICDSVHNSNISKYFIENIAIKKASIIPLKYNKNQVIAIVYKNNGNNFNDEELPFIDMFFSIINIHMDNLKTHKKISTNDTKTLIENAISTLSYSELEAMNFVFNSFYESEKVIVASSIAIIHNVSRSVIVSGLKKLALCNAIYTKSMGNKGTYVKILFKDLRCYLK